ncbi:MAG: hypothetical protein AAFV29_22385, partial [Myxococcota bacterium]
MGRIRRRVRQAVRKVAPVVTQPAKKLVKVKQIAKVADIAKDAIDKIEPKKITARMIRQAQIRKHLGNRFSVLGDAMGKLVLATATPLSFIPGADIAVDLLSGEIPKPKKSRRSRRRGRRKARRSRRKARRKARRAKIGKRLKKGWNTFKDKVATKLAKALEITAMVASFVPGVGTAIAAGLSVMA